MLTLRQTKGAPLTHAEMDANLTELRDGLAGKAAASHGHAIADVTGLQVALDGKAPAAHGHAIADVTGLQVALDGKAAAANPSTSGTLTHSGPAAFGDAFGYGMGAGGAVAQATSKSTAVTLNKASGRITMHAAALAAGASVVFTLNNNKITANDLLLVGCSATSNYDARCLSTNAGTAVIRVTNISAGSLSEAVALNFALIEGVAA